jgi:hypothetical protein
LRVVCIEFANKEFLHFFPCSLSDA